MYVLYLLYVIRTFFSDPVLLSPSSCSDILLYYSLIVSVMKLHAAGELN